MLFYRKKIKLQSGTTAKLSYSNFSNINSVKDENILPLKCAKIAYNYILDNGALKTGYGIETAHLPNALNTQNREFTTITNQVQPHKIWYYKYFNTSTHQNNNMFVCLGNNGHLYYTPIYSDSTSFSEVADLTLSLDSVAINYNLNGDDVLLICQPSGDMGYFLNGTYTAVESQEDMPDIMDMTIHYERLFATSKQNPKRLYFSDDLDPTNWSVSLDDAGFIDFNDERGELKRVFSFNDYLYVLREYGISKVSAFGDQEQFYVTHCYTSNTRIYENTACLCGNILIFLARDGFYAFNGVSTTKISSNIDNLFTQSNAYATSCFYNGCYFLACKLNFNDNITIGQEQYTHCNNVLLSYNLQTGKINIARGMDIRNLISVEDANITQLMCVCLFNSDKKFGIINSNGKIFNSNCVKRWISPLTDLGYGDKRKVIKELYVRTKYDCYVYIITENTFKRIKVYGSNGVSRVPVNVIGTVVGINFESTDQYADISNPQIIINLLGAL